MSDHIKALFEGQDLSEEFKTKAVAIIEAAIEEKTQEVTAKLQEESDAKLQAKITELEEQASTYVSEEVIPQIDKYLSATVTEWVEQNKVALEEASKVELAEAFLTGLVGLAESHNLNIPQGQFDKVGELELQIAEMRNAYAELKDQNITLQTENKNFVRNSILNSVTSELSETQKEKIVTVGSKVEFVNEEQFKEALKSLVESYFPAEPAAQLQEDNKPEGVKVIGESYSSKLIESIL